MAITLAAKRRQGFFLAASADVAENTGHKAAARKPLAKASIRRLLAARDNLAALKAELEKTVLEACAFYEQQAAATGDDEAA
jgi:hypothetical protein